MRKDKARKILGISPSASLKSAEQAYRQKCRYLQSLMAPGNIRKDREQAQNDLLELVDAWKIMQTKKPKTNSRAKTRATVNRQKPARQTIVWDVIQDIAEYWDIVVEMTGLPKPATVAIFIVFFLLLIITLFFRLIKGV
jgi:hypothetical protein